MDFRVTTEKNKDGSIEIYFVGIEHWDDYDLILGLLQQENDCKILSNQESIYTRKAELMRNGVRFQLVQDDMLGNYLYTNDAGIVPILEQLAENIIDSVRIKLEGVQ